MLDLHHAIGINRDFGSDAMGVLGRNVAENGAEMLVRIFLFYDRGSGVKA